MLIENNYSCVIVSNEKVVFTSIDHGVKPLMDFYSSELYSKQDEFVLADKIIGKATVLLAVLCNIKEIYTPIVSKCALAACKKYNILIMYDKVVERIQNRTKDGFCPMETLALDTDDPLEVYKKILDFHTSLKNN